MNPMMGQMMGQPQSQMVPPDQAMAALPPGVTPQILALLLGQMADPMALARSGAAAQQQQPMGQLEAALMGMGVDPQGMAGPMPQWY